MLKLSYFELHDRKLPMPKDIHRSMLSGKTIISCSVEKEDDAVAFSILSKENIPATGRGTTEASTSTTEMMTNE